MIQLHDRACENWS